MKPEALKELQEAVAILDYTKTDLANAVEDIENAVKHLRAAIFMETPAPSMKFNIYDFTNDDGGLRPAMGCVHHEEGYKVASDSHLLIAVKDDYPEELEGKNIDKRGEEEAAKYPQWQKVFPNDQGAQDYRIDFDKLSDWMKEYNAEKKMMGKRGARKAFVKVGPAFFNLELLSRFAKFMKAEGTDILRVKESRKAAACYAEDGSKGLIMPVIATSVDYRDNYLCDLWETKSDKVMMWEAA